MRRSPVKAPHLYELRLFLGDASERRLFAWRQLDISEGRVLLNGEAIFMHGVLYQGYWPESLLTPPDAAAVERDLRAIKACGFNTVRVHAVVMDANFYSLCDQLGLMVWQDMPSGDTRALPVWAEDRAIAEELTGSSLDEITRSPESKAAFQRELKAMLRYLAPYASVVVWVLFNEGWGQSNTQETVDLVKRMDGQRLVNAVSGWNDLGALGHFIDIHNYEDNSSIFGPLPQSFSSYAAWGYNVSGRVPVLGEYGGLGYAVEGHQWSSTAWGYGEKEVNRDPAVFAENLEKLLGRLLAAICEGGVSAAIYTQWMDVETEVNGLLTYDRHFKLPLEFYQEFSKRVMATKQCWAASTIARWPKDADLGMGWHGLLAMQWVVG